MEQEANTLVTAATPPPQLNRPRRLRQQLTTQAQLVLSLFMLPGTLDRTLVWSPQKRWMMAYMVAP